MATTLTKDNFQDFVATDVTLVDYYADWCVPCKNIKPIIEAFDEGIDGGVKVGMVDITASPTLAADSQIRSVPSIILRKDGVEIARRGSFSTETELRKWINDSLAKQEV